MKEKATMEGDVQEAPRESTSGLQGGGGLWQLPPPQAAINSHRCAGMRSLSPGSVSYTPLRQESASSLSP
jgi:hypothetical protein